MIHSGEKILSALVRQAFHELEGTIGRVSADRTPVSKTQELSPKVFYLGAGRQL